MMVSARYKARKDAAQCALECGLSRSYLSHIEAGRRSPELDRCPEIARAYGIPPIELVWVWLTAYAPAVVPILANWDEVKHMLQAEARQRYLDALAAKEAAQRAEKAEAKAARLAADAECTTGKRDPNYGWGEPLGGSLPDGPDTGDRYRPVSERDSVRSALTPWGGIVDEPGAGKRK